MNDRDLMEDVLLVVKGAADLLFTRNNRVINIKCSFNIRKSFK